MYSIHAAIYPPKKYLLTIYYMPGTVLGVEDRLAIKADNNYINQQIIYIKITLLQCNNTVLKMPQN